MSFDPQSRTQSDSSSLASSGDLEVAVLTKLRPVVVAVMSILLLLSVAGFLLTLPLARSGHVDYRIFYAAGYMVRTGHGAAVHDYQKTKEFQDELVGPANAALPFNHLAY